MKRRASEFLLPGGPSRLAPAPDRFPLVIAAGVLSMFYLWWCDGGAIAWAKAKAKAMRGHGVVHGLGRGSGPSVGARYLDTVAG
jgi:hypothetical protein